jgi:hypothetical protein
MKKVQILQSMVLWHFILALLFSVAWPGVIPAKSEDVSVVTFYVH